MKYRLLGESGLRVSEASLGTMTFGEDWGWGSAKDEAQRIYAAYREVGGNFIDTANVYTNGTSERFLGEFMKGHRESVVLATKYSNAAPGTDPNAAGNHRKSMIQGVEASLKRLQTHYIDLYWVHIWDEVTPAEEVMRGLDDLVRAGKVLCIGISDAPAWWVAGANTLAQLRGWTAFVGLQIEYSLIERTVERELIPMARAFDLGVVAWSPLAREVGRSMAQVALAWLRYQAAPVIPIIGARRLAQLEDNLASLDLQLSAAQLKSLDEASRVDLGFPQEFYAKDLVRSLRYGGVADRLVR
jgi:aryl-alcohol dehydrogenase-like predicted oxidoreductase